MIITAAKFARIAFRPRSMVRGGAILTLAVVGTSAARAEQYVSVVLHPAGEDTSQALAAGGGQQAGYQEGLPTGSVPHATLWSASAASATDIHPTGFFDSVITGTIGTKQAGYGFET